MGYRLTMRPDSSTGLQAMVFYDANSGDEFVEVIKGALAQRAAAIELHIYDQEQVVAVQPALQKLLAVAGPRKILVSLKTGTSTPLIDGLKTLGLILIVGPPGNPAPAPISAFSVERLKEVLAKANSPNDYPSFPQVDGLFTGIQEQLAQLLKRKEEFDVESRFFQDRIALLKKSAPAGVSGKKEFESLRKEEIEVSKLRETIPAMRKFAFEAEGKKTEAERLKKDFVTRLDLENGKMQEGLKKDLNSVEMEIERVRKEFDNRSAKRRAEIKRRQEAQKP